MNKKNIIIYPWILMMDISFGAKILLAYIFGILKDADDYSSYIHQSEMSYDLRITQVSIHKYVNDIIKSGIIARGEGVYNSKYHLTDLGKQLLER